MWICIWFLMRYAINFDGTKFGNNFREKQFSSELVAGAVQTFCPGSGFATTVLSLAYSRWEGSIKHPLLGCYLALPLQLYGISAGSISTLLGQIKTVLWILSDPELFPGSGSGIICSGSSKNERVEKFKTYTGIFLDLWILDCSFCRTVP